MNVEGLIDRPEHNRLRSFGRVVNLLCFFVLLLIMGTVIYGLVLRAVWESNYYIAVGIAGIGAIVLLIGLAQQEIAARDKATWRAMAEWQVRATYRKLAERWAEQEKHGRPVPTIDSEHYYEELLLTFTVGMGLGLLFLRGSPLVTSLRMAPVWIAAAVVLIALAFAVSPVQPLGPKTDALFTLASAALIALGLCVEKHIPVSRVGLILGDASYAMYLTHMYFVAGSIVVIGKLAGPQAPWLELVSSIALSVLIAIPFHTYIEKPMSRWLRNRPPIFRTRRPA